MTKITCAICGKPIPSASREGQSYGAFCSERCRQIDLGRWLGERYRVGEPVPLAPDDGQER